MGTLPGSTRRECTSRRATTMCKRFKSTTYRIIGLGWNNSRRRFERYGRSSACGNSVAMLSHRQTKARHVCSRRMILRGNEDGTVKWRAVDDENDWLSKLTIFHAISNM